MTSIHPSVPAGPSRRASDWREQAACRAQASRYWDPWFPPPELFHPPLAAVEVCSECPVRLECLIDALTTNDDGVRGGLTKKQRNALQRRRNRRWCPVCNAPLPTKLPGQDFQVCRGCGLTWRTPRTGSGEEQPESVAAVDLGTTTPLAFRDVWHPSLPPHTGTPG